MFLVMGNIKNVDVTLLINILAQVLILPAVPVLLAVECMHLVPAQADILGQVQLVRRVVLPATNILVLIQFLAEETELLVAENTNPVTVFRDIGTAEVVVMRLYYIH